MFGEIQEIGGTVNDVLQWNAVEVDFNTFNTLAGADSGLSSLRNLIIGSVMAWCLF